jgi:hypothetical protein
MSAKPEARLRCAMGFTKTHDERLDGVLEYIDKYFAGSKALFEQPPRAKPIPRESREPGFVSIGFVSG